MQSQLLLTLDRLAAFGRFWRKIEAKNAASIPACLAAEGTDTAIHQSETDQPGNFTSDQALKRELEELRDEKSH